MEAARPSLQNWSLMVEVVSLLLNLSMLVPLATLIRTLKAFREREAIR